ncbi:hypothetical protein RFEPED_0633 [Rickettsia felis str. Pedreira]|uniref:Uncharacterized protein n=1 Tax=Rickettsia felis str. Pedreira TaxID=1359196 RepID=A0A0F3MUK9_RICFI|nr:hypothetical protein RFEPED_0633 [Rickettsia felis str. Pedreira]
MHYSSLRGEAISFDEAISGSLTRLPRRCYASPRNDVTSIE